MTKRSVLLPIACILQFIALYVQIFEKDVTKKYKWMTGILILITTILWFAL